MTTPLPAELHQLSLVLLGTQDANTEVRRNAESALASLESRSGCHAAFVALLTFPLEVVPFEVKQAAVLRLKNIYRDYGFGMGEKKKVSPEEKKKKEEDRAAVRAALLQCIIQQRAPRLRVQLLQVVYNLWPYGDGEKVWPTLVPELVRECQAGMQSQPPDLNRIYACVCTLRVVLKKVEHRVRDERGWINEMTFNIFPLLLQILQAMVGLERSGSATEETRELTRILLKCWALTMVTHFPPEFSKNFAAFSLPWYECMIFLLEMPVAPPADASAEAQEKARVSGAWKCKKWAAQILLRNYTRWGISKKVQGPKGATKAFKKQLKDWAAAFERDVSVKTLGVFLNILKAQTQGAYVSQRVQHQAFLYVGACVESAEHWKLLKPFVPFLVQESLLQAFCMRPDQAALWKDDPQELIRQEDDLAAEFVDPRSAAKDLLILLLSYRTSSSLQLSLSTIEQVFTTYEAAAPAAKNFVLKEGAMRMFGSIKKLLMSNAQFKAGIESILIRHILPEFQSPLGWMRMRACWCVRRYYLFQWENKNEHARAVQSCLESLRDPELPVKMEAWKTTSYLIEQEDVSEYVKPRLNILIESFYLMYQEIGNDAVIEVLRSLVEHFDKEIVPYAGQLVSKLTEEFLLLINLEPIDGVDVDEQEEEERSLKAEALLSTLKSILYSVQEKPDLLTQLLPYYCRILDVTINEGGIEFYEHVLDFISALTYFPEGAPIPLPMWKYLPLMQQSWHDWAGDFLRNMLSPFDSYINKGAKLLITPEGHPLIQGFFDIIQKILGDKERLIDSRNACTLVESLVANLHGQIDVIIPPLINLTVTRMLSLVEWDEAMAREKAAKAAARAKAAAAKQKSAAKKAAKGGIKKGSAVRGRVENHNSTGLSDEEEEEELENVEYKELKYGLLDNLGILAHYNPQLFIHTVNQLHTVKDLPANVATRLFNIWLSYADSMTDDFDVAKNAVLGFSALASVPLSHWPASWGVLGLEQMLAKLVQLVSNLAAIVDAEEEEEQKQEEDGTDMFHDVHDDKDVYDAAESEEEDDIDPNDAVANDPNDADARDTKLFVDDMQDELCGMNDAMKFESPLDEIDPFVLFAQTMQTLARQEPAFFQHFLQKSGEEGRKVLQEHEQRATERAKEIAEEKEEEAKKAAEKAAAV